MRLGILAAMEEELIAFRESEVQLREHGCTLLACGVGKVNAALGVQGLLNAGATQILVVGTCGALRGPLRQGDLVLAHQARYHDMDARALGISLGQIPYASRPSVWEADARFCQRLIVTLSALRQSIHVVSFVSGDRFLASREEAQQIAETFQADVVDMETAAVAHACDAASVGWSALRVVSDGADGEAATDFHAFVRQSSHRLARVVQCLLEEAASH